MRSIVHLLCAASALLAAACAAPAPATTPGNQPAASGARQASSPAPKGVYDDPTWQELIAAARQEGKLVVASGPNPDMRVQLPAALRTASASRSSTSAAARATSRRACAASGPPACRAWT